MKRRAICRPVFLVVLALSWIALPSGRAGAATYLPLSDADLTRGSSIILLAEVVSSEVRVDERLLPYTSVRLRALEVLKGSLPDETFLLRLPGGVANGSAWSVPGTPSLVPQQQAVLFLQPRAQPGEYGLSEFALSCFDVMEDAERNRYAVRSVFTFEEERRLSALADGAVPAGAVRELEPFLDSLRAAGPGSSLAPARYRTPASSLRIPRRGLTPMWTNIGGQEPGACGTRVPCLVRWFWDTGNSPNAVVRVTGVQTNLSDGSNGSTQVANAVAGWTGIPATDVRYSGPSTTGNVEVRLDVESASGGSWSTPMGCAGGVLGSGGPSFQIAPLTFKGDSYFPAQSGSVEMRKSTCGTGYPSAVFRSGVLHEVGHTVGLGHPDQTQSKHSTTGSAEWNSAVMRSSVPSSNPTTPQTDDIQAIQYYYGTGSSSTCVPDATTLCLNGGRFRVQGVFRTAANQTGPFMAQPVATAPDSGLFWFFSANNLEMLIKVLNGCAFNSRYWVFFAAGTNVEFTLTVTDTQNGSTKTYSNPLNIAAAPVQDTNAFATCP